MIQIRFLLFSVVLAIAPVQKNIENNIFSFISLMYQDSQLRIANAIADNLSRKNYEDVRKDFTNSLKEKLNADMIGQGWENLLAQNGAFSKIMTTSKSTENGYTIVKVRCQFEKENANVEVTFNDDNKVIGLFLKP
jgi:uncharacterized protein DUF3887